MTLYSSREPFNADPHPYRNKYDGSRWVDPGVDARGNTVVFDPRPEYTRPHNNPTNPVLLAYRDGDVNADQVIHMWSALVGAWVGPMVITATHAKHAKKVLTRLAALKEDS